jgi:hypothetical protein
MQRIRNLLNDGWASVWIQPMFVWHMGSDGVTRHVLPGTCRIHESSDTGIKPGISNGSPSVLCCLTLNTMTFDCSCIVDGRDIGEQVYDPQEDAKIVGTNTSSLF